MTATFIRNAVVLSLTLLGVALVVIGMREDVMAATLAAGGGCFLLAWVYARLTAPWED